MLIKKMTVILWLSAFLLPPLAGAETKKFFRIGVLADSWGTGYGMKAEDLGKNYVEQLNVKLKSWSEYNEIDASVSGNLSKNGATSNDVLKIVEDYKSISSFDGLILDIGANDVLKRFSFMKNRQNGTITTADQSHAKLRETLMLELADLKSRLDKTLDQLISKQKYVFFAKLKVSNQMRKFGAALFGSQIEQGIQDLEKVYEDICKTRSSPYFVCIHQFMDGTDNKFLLDMIHLTKEGHQVVADNVFAELEKFLESLQY